MRLVEVEVENYKQYAGTHVFKPGEKAMVAIVGQNGAGKTTLFEAIEWCLYNPSAIKNDSLTPRLQGGKPRVRVVLEDPGSGICYEIERSLKGGSTKAEIYRLDQPDSPVVQGTRQVTEYVTRELTGLSHSAFVSTFFTRQKELSFFGDMGATERREQVGRLLGLETIRVAQKAIGDKRTRKLAEAKVKREQFEEQSKGIDFPAERERLDLEIAEQTTVRDIARIEVETRKQETVSANAAREVAQQRYAANAEFLQALERVNGDASKFAEMQQTAQRDLTAIAEAELEIERQQTQAANEPALRAKLDAHENEKKKVETNTRLKTELDRLMSDRRSLDAVISPSPRIGEPAECASILAASALVGRFDSEIARLGSVDLIAIRQQRDAAKALVDLAAQRDKSASRLEQMEKLASDLQQQVEGLTREGLPTNRLNVAQDERARLQQSASAAYGSAAQTEIRAQQLRTLEQNLRASELGELCPTCARPFRPGEADQTLTALAEQVRLLEQEVEVERGLAEQMTQQAAALASLEGQLIKDVEYYQNLIGRLENGRGVIEAQAQEVATYKLEVGRQLRDARRQDIPSQGEIDLLSGRVAQAEAEAERRPRLESARERLIDSIEKQKSIEAEMRALGSFAYDLDSHQRDSAAWSIARDAVARIEELRKQVAQRGDREATLMRSSAQLSALATERTGLDANIVALGFEPGELTGANANASAALDRERAATDHAHATDTALTERKRARTDLDAFEARLKALNDESTAAQLEHTELQRVYNEFARFEKFVALVVTPHLGEVASELLSTVTDGKYDRLEFTEDYGIEVYDGQHDRFPLSQYSGGERDVIALCARLALSQVIGGQATMPIQFMVLDEVFGSLDLDRRRNLMEMLQRLMEENQAFQQLFVISHVDDVKAGAMFDEVWRVAESADGVSELEQVSVTGTLEDY